MSGETLFGQVEGIRRRAADLAADLSGPARRTATIAQERAILRMLGVDGLDRDGNPLAAALADRYCGADRGRLARGILLPFVVAMMEYDCGPREVALDCVSGAIDLALEAELLERPERLAATEKRATELIAAALERFDANRTATRDLRDVLGQAPEPWLGVSLQATEVKAASSEARTAVADGADLLQVSVPASWEFAIARRRAGLETPGLFASEASPRARQSHARRPGDRGNVASTARPAAEPIPAGSQRGLAMLRKAVDDASAQRRCYARIMTVTSAFAAPEQAVVAAFERIDYVAADPIREIVEDNLDPERALADHSFAHRLQTRAGCSVVVGAGPLALGADVASGIPSDSETRAGRALALQALGVELALADGLPADRLMLGAVPDWAVGDGDAGAILMVAWLRRLVFPAHRFVIGGSGNWLTLPGGSAAVVSALSGSAASLVLEPDLRGKVGAAAADLTAAAGTARAVRSMIGDGALHGPAVERAGRILRAADAELVRLSSEGWSSLLGPDGRGADGERLGRSAVVERADGPGSAERLLKALL
ncbi:MAG TPA: lysine 5,6-aminomutase subunit alpha [Candidatus Limnocylindrales bacterium]